MKIVIMLVMCILTKVYVMAEYDQLGFDYGPAYSYTDTASSTNRTLSDSRYLGLTGGVMTAGAVISMPNGIITNVNNVCTTNSIDAKFFDAHDSAGSILRSFNGTTALQFGVGGSGAVMFGDGQTWSSGSLVNGNNSTLTNIAYISALDGTARLDLQSGTTVSNATAGNEPITLNQARELVTGNRVLYYSPNKLTSAPYTNFFLPTNELYTFNCEGQIDATFVRTNPSVAIGSYYSGSICTGYLYTAFSGGSISIERFLCENTAGPNTTYVKEEVYRYEPSSSNWYEWGEAVASNLVDGTSGGVPIKMSFSVQVPSISTNVPWHIATRTKRSSGTGTPPIIFGGGSNYPSHVDFTVPSSVVIAGLINADGSVPMTANLNMGNNSVTNINLLSFMLNGTNHDLSFGYLNSTQGLYVTSVSNTTTYTNWLLLR